LPHRREGIARALRGLALLLVGAMMLRVGAIIGPVILPRRGGPLGFIARSRLLWLARPHLSRKRAETLMDTPMLAPAPRQLTRTAGELQLAGGRRIVIDCPAAQILLGTARRLQAALRELAAVDWSLSAAPHGPAVPSGDASGRSEADAQGLSVGALLRVDPAAAARPEGYTLTVDPDGVRIVGHDPAGVFYGVCTLAQLLRQHGARLPALQIEDWPDFVARGVMLDVSRDRVPTMEGLLALVDRLAGWKINQLQLYTEHTFAYQRHPEVWADASPFTGEQILLLDAFCRERFIELLPNQNTFGHLARWLVHEPYAALAETHGEFDTPWGIKMEGPFSLCPGDPGSLNLVRDMLDELLPHFSSLTVNVGCDETVDLGQGRSRQVCAERGTGRVYLDFLLAIYAEVRARGRTMQFWGDIVIGHPELISQLPRDAIALEWGYEADHPFAADCARFAAAGLPFYVCPGTSSWNTVAGRTDNALGNLRSAAEHGLGHGAVGYLITDWGDRGHWQAPPISEPFFLAGAAYAWCWEANQGLDVAAAASLHAFNDPAGVIGRVIYDLGNVYTTLPRVHNSSPLFWALQLPLAELAPRLASDMPISHEAIAQARAAIAAAVAPLADARSARPDAALVGEELAHAAALLRHACERVELALEPGGLDEPGRRAALAGELRRLTREQRRLWLTRSRPGGLDDSLAHFGAALADYAPAG
jgi:hexosaminidase